MFKNYYEILGVKLRGENLTQQIEDAYLHKVFREHPLLGKSEEDYQEFHEAYCVLYNMESNYYKLYEKFILQKDSKLSVEDEKFYSDYMQQLASQGQQKAKDFITHPEKLIENFNRDFGKVLRKSVLKTIFPFIKLFQPLRFSGSSNTWQGLSIGVRLGSVGISFMVFSMLFDIPSGLTWLGVAFLGGGGFLSYLNYTLLFKNTGGKALKECLKKPVKKF